MTTIKTYLYIGLAIILAMMAGYIYYLSGRLENTRNQLDIAKQNINTLNDYIEQTN